LVLVSDPEELHQPACSRPFGIRSSDIDPEAGLWFQQSGRAHGLSAVGARIAPVSGLEGVREVTAAGVTDALGDDLHGHGRGRQQLGCQLKVRPLQILDWTLTEGGGEALRKAGTAHSTERSQAIDRVLRSGRIEDSRDRRDQPRIAQCFEDRRSRLSPSDGSEAGSPGTAS
jgi:hypothetical protein